TLSSVVPGVRTVSEAPSPGFGVAGWQGFFVPAHPPHAIVLRIYRETAKAIAAPDTQVRLKAMGNDPVASTPEEFDATFRADVSKFEEIVREAQIPKQN